MKKYPNQPFRGGRGVYQQLEVAASSSKSEKLPFLNIASANFVFYYLDLLFASIWYGKSIFHELTFFYLLLGFQTV